MVGCNQGHLISGFLFWSLSFSLSKYHACMIRSLCNCKGAFLGVLSIKGIRDRNFVIFGNLRLEGFVAFIRWISIRDCFLDYANYSWIILYKIIRQERNFITRLLRHNFETYFIHNENMKFIKIQRWRWRTLSWTLIYSKSEIGFLIFHY